MNNTNNKQTLSNVKQLILKMLREKEWVSSKELLEATQQKYFDRRIRELKDEQGYDIITDFVNGEPHYKLNSEDLKPAKPRTYLNKKQKEEVIKNSTQKCILCGKKFDEYTKPVFDHRIPLIKGGSGDITNFQLLCNECNNQKRSQCRNCDFICSNCYLAFPEKFPAGIILRPDSSELWRSIFKRAEDNKMSIENYIIKILSESL